VKEIYKQIHALELGEEESPEFGVRSSELDEGDVKIVEVDETVEEKAEDKQPEEPEGSSEFGVRSSELSETHEIKVEVMKEVEDKTVEPVAEEIKEEIPVNENEEDEVPLNEIPTPKTTADLFSGATTIADAFKTEEDNSIAANMNHQPVTDLKMAIGINDKFLFINELFKGNPTIYNEAIEKLNGAADINDASSALNHFGEELGWNETSAAFARLNKLVQAKYS
jgi:hypothetical protein